MTDNTLTLPVADHGLVMALQRQRMAHRKDGTPSFERRIDWLDRCIGLLVDHQTEIARAVREDFGARSEHATGLTDVAASIGPLKFAKDHLRRWMRSERRPTTPAILGLLGARAEIHWQPKGVVGIISPWNFPVNLTFAPLAGVLAAGNRAMIKPSEHTPATSALLKRMFAKAFDQTEICVITGGASIGQAFAALPFDHLVFTGATSVGRHVMRAASENLVPVTLELGGKSPAILSRGADLDLAAGRIMNGKLLNAGQVCLAPDYVLAPAEQVDAFVEAARRAVVTAFPTLRDNPDYTALIAERHLARMRAYVDDAKAKGATIVELNPSNEILLDPVHRKMAPTLVLNATDDMAVMQEEIFGPILPIKAYERIDQAIDYINDRDRPLALYWFGNDRSERDAVLARTVSGGVSINDVLFHFAQEALPFGGVGPSGMGAYHGHDGFREFSHRKSVFHQVAKDIGPLRALRPPYGAAIVAYLAGQIRR